MVFELKKSDSIEDGIKFSNSYLFLSRFLSFSTLTELFAIDKTQYTKICLNVFKIRAVIVNIYTYIHKLLIGQLIRSHKGMKRKNIERKI